MSVHEDDKRVVEVLNITAAVDELLLVVETILRYGKPGPEEDTFIISHKLIDDLSEAYSNVGDTIEHAEEFLGGTAA